MQRARMAQIRRDYDKGGSDRSPRRDLRPTAKARASANSPPVLLAPLLGYWLLAIGYRLLAIPLASPVFLPQILNPILRLGRLTGGTSHEIIGQITAAVPVDLGPEPI
jgi:hypothetical protein